MADPRKRIASTRPAARASAGSPTDNVLSLLRNDFGMQRLDTLPDFLLVVEGDTDRAYLQRAADQLRDTSAEDILEVPLSLRRRTQARIAICVAKRAGESLSGGTERMVDLARELMQPVFTHDVLRVVFVFDHDFAGRKAAAEIAKYGYKARIHTLTHDPALHPDACLVADDKDPTVVIEDLLPLSLQHRFFATGATSCDVVYRRGIVKRYKWIATSKGALKNFVLSNATTSELEPLRNVIRLVRQAFGFPPSMTAAPPISSANTQQPDESL